jgi:TonB-linked SusC/RagA family outer membrane protein
MLRKVSLDLRDVRLEAALDSIDRQARIGLQYSARIVPVERRITVRGDELSVEEALGQVLRGTDVEPVVTAAGAVLLVRRREQTGRIVGVVVDGGTGTPIMSAQVVVRGTKYGALTGADGRYIIGNVPTGSYVVEATSIGYAPLRQEGVQLAGGEVRVDFSLEPTAIRLQEVIVTGVVDPIAAVKIPFSVGKISKEQIPVPTGDATTLITAKVPGVTVLNAGTPGGQQYIQIRTPTTISKEGAPMYVVDGVILSDETNPIDLDALDVESVEVVKGAAAASLYGSRAAAGVIAITTNRGKGLAEGSTQVTFRSEYGLSQIGRTIPLNNAHWFVVDDDGHFVDGGGNVVRAANRRVISPDRISDKRYTGATYDNFGEFFHPGQFWMNSVSLAQNNGRTNFLASLNNHQQSGVLRTHGGYDRNTLRLNIDHQLTDDLTVSLSSMHMRSHREDISGSPFFDLLAYPPDVDLGARDADGRFIPYPDSTIATDNPIWRQTSRDDYTDRMQTLARGAMRYQLLPWLRLDSDVGYDRSDMNAQTYTPRGTPTGPTGESTGSFRRDAQWSDALNASASASALYQFADRLTARMTVRGMMERQKSVTMLASGRDLYVRGIPRPELGQARPTVASQQFEIRSNGFFVQTGMDYAGKYIGDFLFRRDGSSLFGPETRWNSYYRAAVAYRISEEPWWPVQVLDEFKLRASVGTAGGRPGFNDQYETYLVSYLSANRSTLGNRRLKPSFTREVELGADLMAFGRLSLELTYAKQVSKDQIVQMPQPAPTGFKNRWENAGTIEGHTYEATLRADLYRGTNTHWSMNLVADRSRNEITEWDRPCFISGLTRHCEGIQRGDIYGYRYMRNASDLPAIHAGSRDQFQVNDDGFLVPVGASNSWRDGLARDLWNTTVTIDGVNYAWGLPITVKDAAMNADSLMLLGSMAPDVRFGYGNTVRWKDFTLYGLIDWQVGGLVHNYSRQQLYRSLRAGDVDQTGKSEETKKPIDYYVRLSSTGSTVVDHFVEPGGFVKLRELSLRYTMPQGVLGSLGLGRLGAERVSLALIGRSLFTHSNYSGFDPEVGSVFYRSDNFGYPNFRTVTGNIEIVF